MYGPFLHMLQGSSIGCVRVSKHTGHSSWSIAKGGLGSGYSGGMTGGGGRGILIDTSNDHVRVYSW